MLATGDEYMCRLLEEYGGGEEVEITKYRSSFTYSRVTALETHYKLKIHLIHLPNIIA